MKKVLVSIFIFMSFLGVQVLAQSQRDNSKSEIEKKKYLLEQGIEKKLITFEYDSWFEKLTVTNAAGTLQDSQALYYGFGLGLEKNWYHGQWGWGLGSSLLGGSATGGDKSGALAYFQARVPWWALRVSPRLFYRWTGRTDLGVDIAAFYKNSTWPDSTHLLTIKSGSELVTGAFVDMRVRVNAKLEMIQSFGMVYKDESIYWRLGLAYRL